MADDITVSTGNNTSPPSPTKFQTLDTGSHGHVPVTALGYSDKSGGTVTADANGLQVQVSQGEVLLTGVTSGTATTPGTAIAYGTASVTALAANSARVGFNIVNTNGTAIATVSYAGTATTTNWVERLPTQYSRFADKLPGLYTGVITILGSAAGTAIVTEW